MGETDSTVAVTGAAGFLGSHICRALLHCGYAVCAVTREGSNRRLPEDLSKQVELRPADVRNPESLNQALQNAHAVVHSAEIVPIDDDPAGLADEDQSDGHPQCDSSMYWQRRPQTGTHQFHTRIQPAEWNDV